MMSDTGSDERVDASFYSFTFKKKKKKLSRLSGLFKMRKARALPGILLPWYQLYEPDFPGSC